MIRTSHILSVHKESRLWVLTTLNSLYVVASFKRQMGRATFKKLDAFERFGYLRQVGETDAAL